MRLSHALMIASLGIAAAAPAARAEAAPDGGYRANLVACIMGKRGCEPRLLRQDDLDYLNQDRTSRTGSRHMAERIADARLSKPIKVGANEEQLDRMHARQLRFANYRSQLRALDDGWVPGVNYPYDQPYRANARPLDAW